MPAKRMNLRVIKEVLRLKYEARLSHQTIAQALGISKGVVAKYAGLAEAAGLAHWALLRDLVSANDRCVLTPVQAMLK